MLAAFTLLVSHWLLTEVDAAAETSGWANELKEERFSVLAINPGFAQTDMGGEMGPGCLQVLQPDILMSCAGQLHLAERSVCTESMGQQLACLQVESGSSHTLTFH